MSLNKPSKVRSVHPVLFALFPVVFLYAHNMKELAVGATVRSLIVVPVAAVLLCLVLRAVLRRPGKAAIITSFFLIAFFSYGRVHEGLFHLTTERGASFVTRNVFLMPVWGAVFLVASYFVFRTRKELVNLTRVLNGVSACLVCLSLLNIGLYTVRTWGPRGDSGGGLSGESSGELSGVKVGDPAELPNIYYIILDAYARDDVLKEIYEFDNSEFTDYLRDRGFYVARKSHSNYIATPFSLGSSLNMRYLDELTEQFGRETDDQRPVCRLLRNNDVFSLCRTAGYRIVSFATGFAITELKNAEIYMSAGWSLNEFETQLLRTTPLISFQILFEERFPPFEPQRRRILYQFAHLKDTVSYEGPLFVFDHIICPHIPFRFGPDGEGLSMRDTDFLRSDHEYGPKDADTVARFVRYYRGQVQFVNSRTRQVVEELLSLSARPPVIIIQADHGPNAMFDYYDPRSALCEKLPILNAYYFPDGDYSQLYESITPVNTFRVVLNKYLGTDYRLLEDRSYFHGEKRVYDFLEMTDQLK